MGLVLVNNLRKNALIVFSLLLFTSSIGYAITWESTPTSLSSLGGTFQANFGEEQYSGFYYNGYFYIGLAHPHSTTSYLKVGKYNDDFTSRLEGWTTISTSPYGSGYINFYNTTHGIAYSDFGQTSRKVFVFSLDDLTATEIWENTGNYPNSCSGTNGLDSSINYGGVGFITIPSRHLDCTEKYYLPESNTAYDLYIPSAYDDDLHDLSLTYDFTSQEETPSYFLFFIYGTGSNRKEIYVSTYDDNELTSANYLDTQSLVTSTENVSSLSSVWNPDDNAYYLNYLINDTYGYGNSNDITNVKTIQYGLLDDYTLTELSSSTFDPSNVDDSANYTGSPHLFYVEDNDLDSFYLLYTVFNSSNDAYLGSFVLKEDVDCECSDWVNTTECVDLKVKQTRNCYPNDCDVESRFVDSLYCEMEFNRTHGIYEQETQTIFDSATCDTGSIYTNQEGVIGCDVYLDIPIECTNVKTNATMRLLVEEHDSIFRTLDNNFTALICNPRSGCDEYTTYTCEDAYYQNITLFKGYDQYIGGETANAGFQVTGSECGSTYSFWGYEGWLSYRILGTLSYSCDMNCGGYSCIKEGLIEYSIQEYIDCTYNSTSKTECIYGCNQDTGLCYESSEEEREAEAGESISSHVTWTKFLFKPETMGQKLIHALIWSVLGGLLLMAIMIQAVDIKNPEVIFLIGFGILMLYFIVGGFIPFTLVLLFIALIVGAFWLKNR